MISSPTQNSSTTVCYTPWRWPLETPSLCWLPWPQLCQQREWEGMLQEEEGSLPRSAVPLSAGSHSAAANSEWYLLGGNLPWDLEGASRDTPIPLSRLQGIPERGASLRISSMSPSTQSLRRRPPGQYTATPLSPASGVPSLGCLPWPPQRGLFCQ